MLKYRPWSPQVLFHGPCNRAPVDAQVRAHVSSMEAAMHAASGQTSQACKAAAAAVHLCPADPRWRLQLASYALSATPANALAAARASRLVGRDAAHKSCSSTCRGSIRPDCLVPTPAGQQSSPHSDAPPAAHTLLRLTGHAAAVPLHGSPGTYCTGYAYTSHTAHRHPQACGPGHTYCSTCTQQQCQVSDPSTIHSAGPLHPRPLAWSPRRRPYHSCLWSGQHAAHPSAGGRI